MQEPGSVSKMFNRIFEMKIITQLSYMSGTAAIEKCHAMIRSDHVSEDTNLHEENTCSIRGTKISKNPTSLLAFHIIFQLIPIKQKEYSCTMVPIDGNTSLK